MIERLDSEAYKNLYFVPSTAVGILSVAGFLYGV